MKNGGIDCIIPNCKSKARSSLKLCNKHDHERRKGRKLEDIIRRAAIQYRQLTLGSRAPFPVRITEDAVKRLRAGAKDMGFQSAYKLASSILEEWHPPGE